MADTFTCPDCGAENAASKIKCNFCGRILDPGEAVAPRDARGAKVLNVLQGGKTAELRVDTTEQRITDLSEQIARFASGVGSSGLLNVFAQHATCGLAIMEVESGSEADLALLLDRLVPPDDRYVHDHGTTGHGRDHLVPVFVSQSITLPVDEGKLALGTWQSIVLIDTNPDNDQRKIRLTFLGGVSDRP
ncbi:MAG: secondary thiamine-phosphate synthase enzyme YjbQ [Actinomycetota bacterium]